MNILPRRTLLFTATLVALTTLSACSSSDDDDTDISGATTGGDTVAGTTGGDAGTSTGGTTDGTDGGTVTADDPGENTTGSTTSGGTTAGDTDLPEDVARRLERDVTFTNCRVGAFDVTGTARRSAIPVPSDITLPAPFTVADLEPFYQNVSLSLVDSRDGSEVSITDAQAFTNFSNQPAVAYLSLEG